MSTELDAKEAVYISGEVREATPPNKFALKKIDHVGMICRDLVRASKFVEQILGGVEIYRAGFSAEDRRLGRVEHIFYRVGDQLLDMQRPRDATGLDHLIGDDRPHWAFGTTTRGLLDFVEHLRREGIPFDGPRSHMGASVVSVYFRDTEGYNLEVTTWDSVPEKFSTPVGGVHGFPSWNKLGHNWQPH